MLIEIITSKITRNKLTELAKETYVEMIKGVVDLDRKILALGGELHADAEEVLLEDGSKQKNLWGFNIFVDRSQDKRLEYTSFINIRPRDANTSIEVKNLQIRQQMKTIIDSLVE